MATCVCAGARAHMCTCVESRGHPEVSLSGMLSTSLETGSAVSLELVKHSLLTGQEALDPFAGACHHVWLFYVGSGNPTQVFWLYPLTYLPGFRCSKSPQNTAYE